MKVKVLAIGGGLASFGLVDALRTNGVSSEDIRIVGQMEKPYSTFVERCNNSGIMLNDRLRSDSSATPGNMWGWPTFGMREAYAQLKRGKLLSAAKLCLKLFTEPVLADAFTPKLSQVVSAIDRECERIGYADMLINGSAQEIAKSDGSWRVTIKKDSGETEVITAEFLHLGVGFQGNKLSSDHQAITAALGDAHSHVYAPHENIYQRAQKEGGTVILRGRGISASRSLERLLQIAENQPELRIVHVMSTTIKDTKMPIDKNRHVQPFNFPKDAFGGHRAEQFSKLSKDERKEFIDTFGKTTTAKRKHWTKLMNKLSKNGQYKIHVGTVSADCGGVFIYPRVESGDESLKIVGFIDATGLIRDPSRSVPLNSLLAGNHIHAAENGLIDSNEVFEAVGQNMQKTNIFLGGNLALGGPFSPVDSFSGFNINGHIVAREIVRRLSLKPQTAKTIADSPLTSLSAWLKWARGVAP